MLDAPPSIMSCASYEQYHNLCARHEQSKNGESMPRPKKPADLKEATDSRHKVNQQAVTLEPLKSPEIAPEWLSPNDKTMWTQVIPALHNLNLCEIDRTMLCVLVHCQTVLLSCQDPAEVRQLAKTISEISDKLNMNPKARAQSGFAQVKTGIDSRGK